MEIETCQLKIIDVKLYEMTDYDCIPRLRLECWSAKITNYRMLIYKSPDRQLSNYCAIQVHLTEIKEKKMKKNEKTAPKPSPGVASNFTLIQLDNQQIAHSNAGTAYTPTYVENQRLKITNKTSAGNDIFRKITQPPPD